MQQSFGNYLLAYQPMINHRYATVANTDTNPNPNFPNCKNYC